MPPEPIPCEQPVRSLLGQAVAVDCSDGDHVQGRLLNATRASLWLIVDEVDRFIRLDQITSVRLAS